MPTTSHGVPNPLPSRAPGASIFRLAPLATWLGLLMIVLLAGFAVLAALGHDPQNGWVSNGPWIAMALVFAGVGVVLARHEPKNSIGWLLLAVGLSFMASTDGSAYLVLDYRAAHGLLPLGPEMLGLSGLGFTSFVLIGIPILVFPTGHVPSRGWRWTLWVFLGLGILSTVCSLGAGAAATLGRRIRIDAQGNLAALGHPTGIAAGLTLASSLLLVAVFPILVAWVLRLALSFRRASGDRRQQLKWLLGGAGVTALAGGVITIFGARGPQGGSVSVAAEALTGLLVLAISAFPIGMGVGILRYRLYDIDRIVSRTLSYAVLTGLLIGVYVVVVTLATRLLPFASPLGVAASTLAAAALFNPLRGRVQRLMDRRFNRARYDAQATIAAFAKRVRDDVDLELVSAELVRAVQSSVEPISVSLWIRPGVPLRGVTRSG